MSSSPTVQDGEVSPEISPLLSPGARAPREAPPRGAAGPRRVTATGSRIAGGTAPRAWRVPRAPRALYAGLDPNGGNGWAHPVHIHFEEGVVLSRDGAAPPIWEFYAQKDVLRIGPEVDSSREVEVALRFREFGGTYMEHCHNTQHEDHSMLLRYDVERPGQFVLLPAPIPSWDGVEFVDSVALPTFRTGDLDPDSGGGSGSGSGGSGSGGSGSGQSGSGSGH